MGAAAHIVFLPLFFIAYAMGLAFKKIVLRGFVGKLQGFFYAWESGAKMLKIGKNGLFSVVDLLLVGGLWGLQKMLKKLAFFKKGVECGAFLVFFYKVCQCFVSKCAKMQCEIALFFMML